MRGSRSVSRTPEEPHTEITKYTEVKKDGLHAMARIARRRFWRRALLRRVDFLNPQRTRITERIYECNSRNCTDSTFGLHHCFGIRHSRISAGIRASVTMRWQRNQTKSQNFATTFFKKILTQPSRFLVKACSHPTMCAHRYTQRIVPGNSRKSRGHHNEKTN